MKLFVYDENNFELKEIKKKDKLYLILSALAILIMVFLLGTSLSSKVRGNSKCNEIAHRQMMRYAENSDLFPEDLHVWEDSVFADYKLRADLWLSRSTFEGTPLTGEILTLSARNAYDSTGILLPVELALAQAQLESSMGRAGKSPIKNPYNVGEHDSGTVKWFKSTFDGTQSYFYYMCRNYLRCRSVDQLFVNFVNCSGRRYASLPMYEQNVRNQYYVIKRWLEKNIAY